MTQANSIDFFLNLHARHSFISAALEREEDSYFHSIVNDIRKAFDILDNTLDKVFFPYLSL